MLSPLEGEQDESGQLIANLLLGDHFWGLQELNLRGLFTGLVDDYSRVTAALQTGKHDLHRLPLDGADFTRANGQAATLRLIRSDKIPKLVSLDLSDVPHQHLAEFLEEIWRCPNLAELRVWIAAYDTEDGLIGILRAGKCRQLQRLVVTNEKAEYLVDILQVVAHKAPCPNITQLELTVTVTERGSY